jgi:hypothetical protein
MPRIAFATPGDANKIGAESISIGLASLFCGQAHTEVRDKLLRFSEVSVHSRIRWEQLRMAAKCSLLNHGFRAACKYRLELQIYKMLVNLLNPDGRRLFGDPIANPLLLYTGPSIKDAHPSIAWFS